MKILQSKYNLMNEAGEGDGAGGTGTGGGEGESSLTSGNPNADLMEKVPEKFHAFTGEGDDKAFDVNATLLKQTAGYSELEKRFSAGERGATDLPDNPDSYALKEDAFNEGIDIASEMKKPVHQKFLKGAHAKGYGNKDVQFFLEYAINELAPDVIKNTFEHNAANSDEQLLNTFQTPEAVDRAKANAIKSMKSFSGNTEGRFEALSKKYGNDPDFIEFAAWIGKEMKEDRSANVDQITGGVTVESLMATEAYNDKTHPEHARVMKQVSDAFEAQYGT